MHKNVIVFNAELINIQLEMTRNISFELFINMFYLIVLVNFFIRDFVFFYLTNNNKQKYKTGFLLLKNRLNLKQQ